MVSGAEPLFFLDYFAVGKLDVGVAEQVIAGIAEGCRQAGCALLGGETAELPGFYQPGEYDLAGFCVGVVERDRRVDGREHRRGRRAAGRSPPRGFTRTATRWCARCSSSGLSWIWGPGPDGLDEPLGEALLRPTRIYVRALRKLHAAGLLQGAAHITGGGLVENPARMLPAGAAPEAADRLARLDLAAAVPADRPPGRHPDRGDAADLQPRDRAWWSAWPATARTRRSGLLERGGRDRLPDRPGGRQRRSPGAPVEFLG